jgi:hypothetical protein
MQKHVNLKHVALLLGLLLTAVWCGANEIGLKDGFSNINIKEGNVQDLPRGYAIQASINGHYLTVVFTENLGQVDIEVTTSTGGYVQANSCITPNGIQFYIPNAGDYIVTFTLSNGDMYAGEFTVTD